MTTHIYPTPLINIASRIYNSFKKVMESEFPKVQTAPVEHLTKVDYKSQFDLLERGSLFLVSDLKGIILYANEKFCDTSKYTLEELVGSSHSLIGYSDNSDEFKSIWRTILNGQIWQGELKNKTKDGTIYWVYATIYPVMDKTGKPSKYLSSSRDISHEKMLEEKVQTLKTNVKNELYESVRYAKQVHGTFLTPERVLHETFEESFLIYKAQNIVSGDFHMIQKKDNISTFILGDSTGHGVSASYISIMILNILNRILRSSSYTTHGILEDLHTEINTIRNSNPSEAFIESADMAFCKIDHEAMTLEYSIAKLRGIVVRDGEVIELDRDKYSIGEQWTKEIQLSTNTFNLMKDDLIYLYTDGFIDQFGGPLNKKFSNKRLLETIKTCVHLSMDEQKTYLNEVLRNWQGDNEQTDDVSLVGVRV